MAADTTDGRGRTPRVIDGERDASHIEPPPNGTGAEAEEARLERVVQCGRISIKNLFAGGEIVEFILREREKIVAGKNVITEPSLLPRAREV